MAGSTAGCRRYIAFIFLFLIVWFSLVTQAQDRSRTLIVVRTETPPVIDGVIDDPCWKEVDVHSGFVQYDPDNGRPASEETRVWVTYDSHNIYFAFEMIDSLPGKIWAELTPRNQFENNDSISVILDTYNDQRTSLSFTVNPRGVQKNSVETIWRSGARMTDKGWTAELAIPFKSLRFSAQRQQTWGINFERYLPRRKETSYWTKVARDRPLLQQMGELSGLEGVKPGYNLEFFPYLGFRTSRWEEEKDDKLAVGLDFKYGILPNLILDLTASPDFSEVESDPFIHQLAPQENYLQENRPFFSEGSQYFQTATQNLHYRENISLFYSRRISTPKVAAKLSGKTGGFSFGILSALNDEIEGTDRFYQVVRVQKDILKNSQIGIYYAGFESKGDYNRNMAVDYSFNLSDIYHINGMNAFTFNPDAGKGSNGIHILKASREPDEGWTWDFSFQRVEENVSIDSGFLSAYDFQKINTGSGWAWRFDKGWIQHLSLSGEADIGHDSHWNPTERSLTLRGSVNTFSKLSWTFFIISGKSRYQTFNSEERLIWDEKWIPKYGITSRLNWFQEGLFKGIELGFEWDRKGIYSLNFLNIDAGTEINLDLGLRLRPMGNLEIYLSSGSVWQTIRETGEDRFHGTTYSATLHYQFTRAFYFTTRLLGETSAEQYNFDALLGYHFGAGNLAQLSFKKSARSQLLGREDGYSITLKVSYLFRL